MAFSFIHYTNGTNSTFLRNGACGTFVLIYIAGLDPVSESGFTENSEFVNPEMRETLGFLFQKER